MTTTNQPPEAVEADNRVSAFIANDIRGELVCCDVYDQLAPARANGTFRTTMTAGHHACYWGEAAARIAEGREDAAEAAL